MAYSELIKDYERVRDYMRQFYVYGFRSREEYDAKSARSYDNERRRIESWLGDYMSFRQDSSGKQVFLSVDSRRISHNPLYQAFKAKSFTDKDITLHFYLLDILADGEALTTGEIVERIDRDYLSRFDDRFSLDTSTVRKKLKEYEELGLVFSEKQGREVRYRLAESDVKLKSWGNAISFYSEESPLGVVGAYLLDRLPEIRQPFRFKHHYILHAMDSERLLQLLEAMDSPRKTELTLHLAKEPGSCQVVACPTKIYISTQTGRQYVLAYQYDVQKFTFYRIYRVLDVELREEEPEYDQYRKRSDEFRKRLWGVSTGDGKNTEHIEMTIRVEAGEAFVPLRMEREKRCGKVVRLDRSTWRFSADVYDPMELLPWLRTFIGRIVKLECSDPAVTERFYGDLDAMFRQYGGDGHAVP